MGVRVAINGLGRIGRCALRRAMQQEGVELVAVNDLAPAEEIAYLIRHDSVYGAYPGEVSLHDGKLVVDDQTIPISSISEPADLHWSEVGADIVIESTGVFRSRDAAAKHLEAGARKVIVSAPSDDADLTIVPGVNHDSYDAGSHDVVSMASCTTNCVAPVVKVLNDSFGVEWGLFTTVHAYTSSQGLVDAPARKRRRGRAAALSVVPTTTGAAQATERVLPELEGRLDGMAMRVPVPAGSITDLVAELGTDVDEDAINDAMRRAAQGDLIGILGVSEEELVSSDIVGDTRSALVDAASTSVLMRNRVKVLAWYDNEMGYAARLVDLARQMGRTQG